MDFKQHIRDGTRKRQKQFYEREKAKKRPLVDTDSDSSVSSTSEIITLPSPHDTSEELNHDVPIEPDFLNDNSFNTNDNEYHGNFDPEKDLYQNSQIKYGEFLIVFVSLIEKLHIGDDSKDLLVKFLHTILPIHNQVPASYFKLKQDLNVSQLKLVRRQYVCMACNKKIEKHETCDAPDCTHFCSLAVNKKRLAPYFINNNYTLHFQRVIDKNWSQILAYKTELASTALITDTCNADAYKRSKEITLNSICIILFVDEAQMTKTSNENNVYTILGLIMNLPPRMRSSYLNILNFMLWGGYLRNFNNLFNYFNPPLNSFFNKDFQINSNLKVIINFILILNRVSSFNTKLCFNSHCLGTGTFIWHYR